MPYVTPRTDVITEELVAFGFVGGHSLLKAAYGVLQGGVIKF